MYRRKFSRLLASNVDLSQNSSYHHCTLKINSQIQLFTLHVHLYQEMVHDEMHSGIPGNTREWYIVQLMVLTGVPVA